MSRSTSWFLLVFCLVALLLLRESRQPDGTLAGVDRAFFDWLVTNARPEHAGLHEIPVTLVEIDDSVAETPGRVPLSPLECGEFLHSMSRYDPAVVAVEPVLNFPQVNSATEEILLQQALGISKLLLGVQLGESAGHGRDPATLPALANAVEGSHRALPDHPEIVAAPSARLLALATASGATNLPGAAAGPVRDVPLLFRSRGRILPGFILQALTLSLRLAPSEINTRVGQEIQLGDRLRLPINRAGNTLLDAREFGQFRRLSLDDLPLIEAGQAPPQIQALAERMHSGVVVLGRTDRAARTLRLPDGRPVSPAEVFAWAVTSLQRTPPVRRASSWWDAGIAVAFALAGVAGRRGGRITGGSVAGVLMLVYGLVALSFFEWSRLWLPVALPAGLTLLLTLLPWIFPEPAGATGPGSKPAGGAV